jgi:hypothetical protein
MPFGMRPAPSPGASCTVSHSAHTIVLAAITGPFRSHAPRRPLMRKNVPNTKQIMTVIVRLCLPIHTRKAPSIDEAL